MAVTVTQKLNPKTPGDSFVRPFTVALDTSYPNPAGYVFTPATFGLNVIKSIANIEALNLPAVATWNYWVVPTYDVNNQYITSFALHLAVVATGVEVANTVNVSTASYTISVEGQ